MPTMSDDPLPLKKTSEIFPAMPPASESASGRSERSIENVKVFVSPGAMVMISRG